MCFEALLQQCELQNSSLSLSFFWGGVFIKLADTFQESGVVCFCEAYWRSQASRGTCSCPQC